MLVVHWRALNTVGMTLCVLFWPFFLSRVRLCGNKRLHLHDAQWRIDFRTCCFDLRVQAGRRLIDAPVMSYRLTLWMFISFYFWIPICTVWRAEEGSNAFTHLVMCRRPLTAAHTHTHTHTHTQFFFFFCSPALNLTLAPSLFLSLTPF